MNRERIKINVVSFCFMVFVTLSYSGSDKDTLSDVKIHNYGEFKQLLQVKTVSIEDEKDKIKKEDGKIIFPNGKSRIIKKELKTFYSNNKNKLALLDYYERKLQVIDNKGNEALLLKTPRDGYYDVLISDSLIVTFSRVDIAPGEEIIFHFLNKKVMSPYD